MLADEEILQRKDLDRLIDERIRAATRLAYDHNEFIHRLFESAAINPHTDISGKADLLKAYKKGVRTFGNDISKCYADYCNQMPILEIWTSGSSNEPKKVLLSPDSVERFRNSQRRIWGSVGVTDGQRILGFSAPPPYGTSFSIREGLRELNVRTLIHSLPTIPPNISRAEKKRIADSYIRMIYEFNPDHVRGGVWPVFKFAQFLQEYGFDSKKLAVKTVAFGGEPTTIEKRKMIGELWNAEPFDHYSSTEAAVMGYECKAHLGLHLNETSVFLVATSDGEQVSDDEEGTDLVTDLYAINKMPATFFINYSHGDHIKPLSGACSCGRTFRLMSHPLRDTEKKLLSGFGLDTKYTQSFRNRVIRKIRKVLSV